MTVKELFKYINGPVTVYNIDKKELYSGYQRKGYYNDTIDANDRLGNSNVVQIYGEGKGFIAVFCSYH